MTLSESVDKNYDIKSQIPKVKEHYDQITERSIDKITDRHIYGPDGQADQKALLIQPGHWTEYDPFLLLAEDWFSTEGFDWHPHRGIETITMVLDGKLEHYDNRGGHGILRSGDVQWMTAGRGLLHSEMAYRKQPVHTLQLWVNLPASQKFVEPKYQDLRGDQVPVRKENGIYARVFSGQSGNVRGPAANHVPVTMLDVRLTINENIKTVTFVQEIPAGDEGFIYVIEGQGSLGLDKTNVSAGQIAHLKHTDITNGSTRLTVVAKENLRFLLWTGQPLHEPVVSRGPFVMNTQEQIVEAFADYQSGVFGHIPKRNIE